MLSQRRQHLRRTFQSLSQAGDVRYRITFCDLFVGPAFGLRLLYALVILRLERCYWCW
jgi:hypothetical protein